MQQDKALLRLGEETLLGRAVRRLQGMGFAVVVSGHAGAAEAGVEQVPRITDRFADAGPLAGLEAVLTHRGHQAEQLGEAEALVLFVPVDVPLLPDAFFDLLWQRALHSGAWATVPWSLGRQQPLCAVYDARLAAPLAVALKAGERKVLRALEQAVPAGGFDQFSAERVTVGLRGSGWPAPHQWFQNANTRQDWDALRQAWAGQRAGGKSALVLQPRI